MALLTEGELRRSYLCLACGIRAYAVERMVRALTRKGHSYGVSAALGRPFYRHHSSRSELCSGLPDSSDVDKFAARS
jgi:hypothetical protein